MPPFSLFKITLLTTMYMCDTLSFPVKSQISELDTWLTSDLKPVPHKTRFTALFDSKSPYTPIDEIIQKPLDLPTRTGCNSEKAKIIFPLKYRVENGLENPLDSRINLKLPVAKMPYEKYNVLVATAPPELDLGEDGGNAMAIYIVFNDDKSYPSPLNLPNVYFVKKGATTSNALKDLDPIFLIKSNRTAPGLRSKEIQKFVKFTNKLTNHVDDIEFSYNLEKPKSKTVYLQLRKYTR